MNTGMTKISPMIQAAMAAMIDPARFFGGLLTWAAGTPAVR